ncbi:hypothetical protein DEH18_29775 [Streptomyces sp. NHF165]|uniref:Lsr2 family DNA-binding protein n=1 Tax=Streptomyces TaxID=1883 RepID=UPI00132F2BDA|nr:MULTISPECIES: SMI1/KNR4 family protein [Streptomyces]QHF97332.1 hypothetical protein DEH18_29775 [Streptomyces sp. NHF165]
MNKTGELIRLCPPPEQVAEIDWPAVEQTLGMSLPRDYKELASVYGPGSFCDFISIYHPNETTPWVSLTGHMPMAVREQLVQFREQARFSTLPHEPEELFAVGVTDNGNHLFWVTEPRSEPDAWSIAIDDEGGHSWYSFDGSLTEFLVALLSGREEVPVFPGGLLEQGAGFSPASPPRGPVHVPPATGPVPLGEVRQWARENGYDVPDRGRVPGFVLDAWKDAHGG